MSRIKATTTDIVRSDRSEMNARRTRDVLAHNLAQDLIRFSIPVLAMTWTGDLQVDPADLA